MAQSASPTRATERPTATDRPTDCECRKGRPESSGGLPCWPCYRDGFDTAAAWHVEVGDRVRADWSDGEGAYDEIRGVVTAVHDEHPDETLVVVDVDYDSQCDGGDTVRGGGHDCALTWVEAIVEPQAYEDPQAAQADAEPGDGEREGTPAADEKANAEADADGAGSPADQLEETTLRALDPERPLTVKSEAPGMFVVESSNDEYVVDIQGTETCTCPGFNYHGGCRHPRRVKILIGEYALPEAAKEIDIDPALGTYIEPDLEFEEA